MQVIATKVGFYRGSRIREGQEFDVPEGTKGKWFKPVEEVAEVKKAKPAKGKADKAPETLSELAKMDAKALAPEGGNDELV